MKSFITKPKYDGYKIRCRRCKCEFFVPFEDVHITGYDEIEAVLCPGCKTKIWHTFVWRKCKEGGDK